MINTVEKLQNNHPPLLMYIFFNADDCLSLFKIIVNKTKTSNNSSKSQINTSRLYQFNTSKNDK